MKEEEKVTGWTGLDTGYALMKYTECPTELLSDRQKQQEESAHVPPPTTSDEGEKSHRVQRKDTGCKLLTNVHQH